MGNQISSATGAPVQVVVPEALGRAPRETQASGDVLPESGKPSPAEEPASVSIEEALAEVRDAARELSRELDFRIDEDTGRTIITVLNSETGEVVRQIPSEEILRIATRVSAGGPILLDSTA